MKVLMHIGRGGRFNNQGHVKCLEIFEGDFNPDKFGINYYFNFSNISEVVEKFEAENNEDFFSFLDSKGLDYDVLVTNWNDNNKAVIDTLGLCVKASDFGVPVITNDSGNEICTLEEFYSPNGVFDLDGDYDTYKWFPIEQANEEDWEIIKRDLNSWEYEPYL